MFEGGPGNDDASPNYGLFYGGPGHDTVGITNGGTFEGGPGMDRVERNSGEFSGGEGVEVNHGTCRNVEVGCDNTST